MISELNPLEELIEEYFTKLNIINGYFYQLEKRIESHRLKLTDFYSENAIDINRLFAGTSIAFSDLSEWPEDGWRKNYISGKFYVKGENYLTFAESLIQREAALSIALGYETLEAFLKIICSKFILLNQRVVNKQEYQKFKDRYNGNANSDIDYWNEYLRLSYKGKNNKYLLKFIREVSPQFEKLEKANNRLLSLSDWFEVSSVVRHSIIHSNSIIKEQQLCKLNNIQMNILNEYFPGTKDNGGYTIRLGSEHTKTQLVILAEYGFLIFKSLSMAGNYKWKIFRD